MIDILRNAPTWAWLVLAGLIALGLMQSRPRRLPRAAILFLPAVMTALSLYAVGASFTDHLTSFAAWGAGGAAALALNGTMLRSPRNVGYDAATQRFDLPGSWTPLALMMVIYCTRFATIATTQVAPATAAGPGFVLVASALLGFLAGLFVSRALVIVTAARAVNAPA